MAKKGRAAQALATAAIGSFIAGTIGTLLVAFFTPDARRPGGRDRRAVVLRDHAAVDGAGQQRARRVQAARLHRPVHRPHHRAGRARPLHRPGAAHRRLARARRRHRHRGGRGRRLRDRRGAVDRRPPAPQADRRHPGRAAVHGPRRLAPLLGAVAARHRARLPVRRPAGRWRGDADVPVLHHRAQAGRPPRWRATSSARARSRASPGPEAANNASAAGMFVPLLALGLPGHRDGVDPAGRHADVRHRARADPDDRPARPGLDAAGQPADRQHPAAGDQPAARAAVGQAAADPATAALRRHPLLRLASAPTASTRAPSTSPCCWSSAAWASRSAASASRSCR